VDAYKKNVNAYNTRYDISPIKNWRNWITLRKYRSPRRKTWRNLDIDNRFVGKLYDGRLDDFSNAFKDITKNIWRYSRQMADPKRLDTAKYYPPQPNERETYYTDPGDGDSWTNNQDTQSTSVSDLNRLNALG
jgi:hypothetical protein